jgi:hypothetical protein
LRNKPDARSHQQRLEYEFLHPVLLNSTEVQVRTQTATEGVVVTHDCTMKESDVHTTAITSSLAPM